MRRVALAVSLLVMLSCGHHAPILGHLQADERKFHFEHEIQLFEASNGMRIALLRDDRTNLVTVDVRYQVGSAEDPAGLAGMAHLVEHLSFLTRARDQGPTLFDELGEHALWFNAWTNADETHYTETGFADQLDALLALEAQRMAQSCDRLDEKLFLRERDVVLQEQAERSGPLDDTIFEIAAAVWGKGHPYARAVGSRAIAGAQLADACAFMDAHYGPDQAIVVITGDFDDAAVSRSLQEHFGALHKNGVVAREPLAPAEFAGDTTRHTADIEYATAVAYFPAPAWGTDDTAPFQVASAYLAADLAAAAGQHRWIVDTGVSVGGGQRQRVVAVYVVVNEATHLEDAAELLRTTTMNVGKRSDWSGFRPMVKRLQGDYLAGYDSFLGRGTWIADYLMYTTHNWFFLREMAAFDELSAADVRDWAAWNFTDLRMHLALITPSGHPAAGTQLGVVTESRAPDVQPWRSPVDPADAHRPLAADTARVDSRVEDFTLANGLRVLLAHDSSAPVVDARLVYPVGTAADPADRPGLAYATALLVEPDTDIDDPKARAMIAWAFKQGTAISFDVDENTTQFSARGMAMFADWTVWRLFYMLDYSVFPSDEIDAMHAAAARAGDPDRDVRSAALREKLFGKDHPYAGDPLTGDDIRRIGRADCERFRAQHYKAKGATLIVSGGFDLVAMEQEIKEIFATWDAGDPAAIAPIPRPHPARGPSWLAFRDASISQAHLTIAFATGSEAEQDRPARMVLQEMLEDRMRVAREGLAASYGVHAAYGSTFLRIDGRLDPDRGDDATVAILAELTRLRDPDGDLAEDFVRARKRAMAMALADTAGASDTAEDLVQIAAHGLDPDYFADLAAAIGALTLDDVTRLIAEDLAERRMVVAVSGREEVVQAILAAAGAKAEIVDAD